jgi:two-component system sensor histidine kinase and response regulator WspE
MSADLTGFSLWDLFRGEVESHSAAITAGLLELEQAPADLERIKALMRAAHSVKGAARVVRHTAAVDLAHAMEDRLVAAQGGTRPLDPGSVQALLDGVDLLARLSPVAEADRDTAVAAARADLGRVLTALTGGPEAPAPTRGTTTTPAPPRQAAPIPSAGTPPAPPEAAVVEPARPAIPERATDASTPQPSPPADATAAPAAVPPGQHAGTQTGRPGNAGDRSIRLSAQTVTRMVGLAAEATVGLRWLGPFSNQLENLKRRAAEASTDAERLATALAATAAGDDVLGPARGVHARLERVRQELTEQLAGFEGFLLRQEGLSSRLYAEVIATRMRPFGEVTEGYARLVRDLSRALGKQVRLVIEGRATPVDRDVAALIDAPLGHALRNALDHGIESPEERVRRGKPEAGTIRLSACHRAGMLRVEVADDGRGVDVERIRALVVERGLADAAMAARLAEREILEFLFLPGFSTAAAVTDVSGRGVGLDVVNETLKTLGGRFDLANHPGRGLTIGFDLPLTLSVLRALVVEVDGEPYALPITRIERVVEASRADLHTVEGRQYVTVALRGGSQSQAPVTATGDDDVRHVGIVTAAQVLELGAGASPDDTVAIVVLRDRESFYGFAVDRLVGERTLAVRPLDARLGKVKDVSAAGLTSDGTPVLVLDPDDVVRSIDVILSGGRLAPVGAVTRGAAGARKRVLVVDDSITVREVERQLLESRGYLVDTAVDGMDGWNAVRTGHYDLVVSDVDMPRLDGIELVRRIRGDRRLGQVPVIVVSYKDREEDRLRGLDAGASYYLAKASFQDDTFLRAVDELIGAPEAS